MPAPAPLPTFRYRRHPHLYEISTWVWLEELSAAAGRKLRLVDVPAAEWDRLAALGFDFVWLMGVWKRSSIGRRLARTDTNLFQYYDAALPGWRMEEVPGSPYSVQAYEPDPRIATWAELDAVRARLRERGVGLILDFVTNHTGLDHPWVTEHPEYYVQGTLEDFRRNPAAFYLSEAADGAARFIALGRDPYFAPWPDTAQLNYFHAGTRAAVIDELRRIAQHCDGVRCDMAMLVLNDIFAGTWGALLRDTQPPAAEFWPDAVAALPGFLWMAEVYWDLEWRMQQLGFQFAYDKRLYDRLRDAPHEVNGHLHADLAYQNGLVRFLENHDEPRSAAVFDGARLRAAAVLAATLPGMRFYYHGQFEGRRIHPPVHLGAVAAETADGGLRAFYEHLLRVTHSRVFHEGEWRIREVSPAGDATHANLVAYEWRRDREWRIVVVNLSGETSQGMLLLGESVRGPLRYDFHDLLDDAHYEREEGNLEHDGLYVRLDAGMAHIFEVKPES